MCLCQTLYRFIRHVAQGAFYVTCPCHKSVKEDGKERKCKKEISVTTSISDEIAVRMIAWWLLQGFWLH